MAGFPRVDVPRSIPAGEYKAREQLRIDHPNWETVLIPDYIWNRYGWETVITSSTANCIVPLRVP